MTTKIIILVVTMGLFSSLFLGQDPQQAETVAQMVRDGALVIDTRSPGEFTSGHIDGAVNIPYDVIDRSIGNLAADKNAAIVVYCHSGMRSGHARKMLLHMGYTQVINGGSLRSMRKALEN